MVHNQRVLRTISNIPSQYFHQNHYCSGLNNSLIAKYTDVDNNTHANCWQYFGYFKKAWRSHGYKFKSSSRMQNDRGISVVITSVSLAYM